MTEADVYPLLAALAGGQVYPYVAPLSAQGEPAVSPPWIVFSMPSENDDDVMCGQSGASSNSVQIDVYARTIDEATSLRSQAKVALKPLMPTSVMGTKGYESDTGLYRATIEVQVWE